MARSTNVLMANGYRRYTGVETIDLPKTRRILSISHARDLQTSMLRASIGKMRSSQQLRHPLWNAMSEHHHNESGQYHAVRRRCQGHTINIRCASLTQSGKPSKFVLVLGRQAAELRQEMRGRKHIDSSEPIVHDITDEEYYNKICPFEPWVRSPCEDELTDEDYYDELCAIKPQINTALEYLMRLKSSYDYFEDLAEDLVDWLKMSRPAIERLKSRALQADWDWDTLRDVHTFLRDKAMLGRLPDKLYIYHKTVEYFVRLVGLDNMEDVKALREAARAAGTSRLFYGDIDIAGYTPPASKPGAWERRYGESRPEPPKNPFAELRLPAVATTMDSSSPTEATQTQTTADSLNDVSQNDATNDSNMSASGTPQASEPDAQSTTEGAQGATTGTPSAPPSARGPANATAAEIANGTGPYAVSAITSADHLCAIFKNETFMKLYSAAEIALRDRLDQKTLAIEATHVELLGRACEYILGNVNAAWFDRDDCQVDTDVWAWFVKTEALHSRIYDEKDRPLVEKAKGLQKQLEAVRRIVRGKSADIPCPCV